MKILKNSSHKITQFLIYIYTQENFIYKELKKASREKNESRIMTLGPYAFAFSFILANPTRFERD